MLDFEDPFEVMIPLLSLLFFTASPQNVALTQDFNSGTFPPTGWSQQKSNPASAGWKRHAASLRAWHEDESLTVGQCRDLLISSSFSLVGFTEAYGHVDVELQYPEFLANHPYSQADGETSLYFRSGTSGWVQVWTECRTAPGRASFTARVPSQFLGNANVKLGLRYIGKYAHETWVDLVQVDDARVAPGGGTGGGTQWPNLTLPTAFVTAPFTEDFESWGGTPPPFMALTSLNSSTLQADPEAWCSIAGGTVASNSGVRHLEMGLNPGSINYHNVRNSLIIGVDGAASPGWQLDFQAHDYGEEVNAFDGVWVSANGQYWVQLLSEWGGYPATWTAETGLDLGQAGIPLNGTFYLMFAQEDNYPYASLDGVGIDDIAVRTTSGGGCGLTITMVGTCPGPANLAIDGARPGSRVMLLYGAPGSYTWNGTPCSGLTIGMNSPKIGASWDPASALLCLPVRLPGSACGLAVQAVDLDACCAGGVTIL